MARFDEPSNTARNSHISASCKPANNGASERAGRIGRALFHLDGLADVVDSDIRANAGFVASCCRFIDRELRETEPESVNDELLIALKTAWNVIRHAVQESTGRVSKEIVGGWAHHAEKIETTITNAKGN